MIGGQAGEDRIAGKGDVWPGCDRADAQALAGEMCVDGAAITGTGDALDQATAVLEREAGLVLLATEPDPDLPQRANLERALSAFFELFAAA